MEFQKTAAAAHLKKDAEIQKAAHLRDQLQNEARAEKLTLDLPALKVSVDFSRQRLDENVMSHLYQLADEMKLNEKRAAMFKGDAINVTEDRAVYHVACRAGENEVYNVGGQNVVPDVHAVLKAIHTFSDKVRAKEWVGYTGKPLTDVVCIGIGGSYLGVEFVVEALKTEKSAAAKAVGRRLHFLANVDPIDVARAVEGFHPETTLVIVISKTFTTAETMLNARTLKKWLLDGLKDEKAIAKHFCAVSTNLAATGEFGIDSNNVFGFWDWVGGRYSLCSAVGILPIALQYGFEIASTFLKGCRDMDHHFRDTSDYSKNLPVLMGLCSFWNATYMDFNSVAVLPYCQALHRFAAHIQQLTMESNGKGVTIDGKPLPEGAGGEIFFGEPGTNGQHSFYQLIHQGRVVPCEFIGFKRSQNEVNLPGEIVSNHDELMSNFFAQPDALALGKTAAELRAEKCPEALVAHKEFSGNRPSVMLLMETCDAYSLGLLLSLYEHRTAVQGFLWNVNSFDQWGVQLGKVLANNMRTVLHDKRKDANKASAMESGLPHSTKLFLKKYLSA